jgi:23S rRNA pseudouridine1911/1915/1917 synthase
VNIPVVYEDEWLLVLNKPPGLLTIPTPKKESRTLTSILNEDLKEKGLSYRLYPCHRLDRETSGLIIYAKGKSMQRKMMEIFGQKKIKKTYLAFVQGLLSNSEGEIRNPLEGKIAITKYRVMEKRKGFSIVEIMPLTGRTNQIRIHFKQMGHPLLGDTKFAFRRDFKLKAKRLCLHAKKLEFIHPLTKKVIPLIAPLPLDMEDFLRKH